MRSIDVMPTVLELLGLPVRRACRRVLAAGLARRGARSPPPHSPRSVPTGSTSWHCDATAGSGSSGPGRSELYHLADDPREERPVAAEPPGELRRRAPGLRDSLPRAHEPRDRARPRDPGAPASPRVRAVVRTRESLRRPRSRVSEVGSNRRTQPDYCIRAPKRLRGFPTFGRSMADRRRPLWRPPGPRG